MNRINTKHGPDPIIGQRKTTNEAIPEEAKRAGQVRRRIEDLHMARDIERIIDADNFTFRS